MNTSRKHTRTFAGAINALSRRMFIGLVLFALAGGLATVSAIKLNARRAAAMVAQRYIAPGGSNAGDCSNSGSPCATLAYAVSQSATGDTINAAAGTYVLSATVNVNVANLTIKGASSATTIFQIAQAVGNALSINAAGVTVTDLQIQKTDVTGVHELILVNAAGDNFTLQNSLIQGPDPGTPWSVNGIVSRALVSSTGGVTGLLIQNNTIKYLRQPAYFNPGTVGTVSNNNVGGTRGWVVDGATINFTGNTWGPPPNQGADIALLASCNPADYPNLGALSNANNNAFISGQFAGASSGVGTIYVDDSAAPGGDGSQATPFQTIAAGVTAVLPGGIVNVADGTYVENPAIGKSLSLIGANAGTAGAATRVAESIIRTNGNQTAVVGVTAANVTINGFTIDGDDPGVTGAALASGDDSNVSYAVRPTGTVGNLTVSNNIIKKVFIGLRGDVAGQGNVVTANWFDRIGNFDFGYAVSIRNNYYANVTNNKVTKAWTGVHINNHNGAGGPANFLITGNQINSYAGGILYWLQYNQATGATISNNTITAETGAVANNFGILVVTNQDAVASTFTGNTISGHDYGVGFFNVPTSSTITLGATNSISGSKLAGVLMTDNLNFNPVGTTNFLAGGPGAASIVNLTGLSISGNVATGVKLEGTTNTQTLNINGASISGGVTGLLVTGAPTALTGNTLNNTAFSGQSGNYIALANSALDNLTINATAVTFDGLTGAAATVAQNLAIEDKIKHAIDDPSLGFIRVKTGGIFITANSFNAPATTAPSIQRGIDAASSGETVNVGAGTFIEDININQTLIVCGAGPASTTISGAIGGAGSTVAITANNVEFKNFKVTREGNTAAMWNDPNLNTAGLSIQGQAVTGANIHDNLFMQNRSGIDINNSNGHTVRNNVLTDNRTGMIFRNQTDNLTVVENTITNNWTVGIVFLDGSGGSNTPVQTAANCTFSNNNLSGNWYGQIVDRQSGGSLPTPGTNLKNFSANWFGSTTPLITTANSAEPGYAAQIPSTVPGGSATAPGGQPDIAGPASTNFDITPLLDVATDTNVETVLGRGTFGFQGSYNVLNVITANSQTGAASRIQEGVNLVNTGGTVKTLAGFYTGNADVNKAATLSGAFTTSGTLGASAAGAIISPGFSPGIINSGDLSLAAGTALNIELASSTTPGAGYDQINVIGAVNLGGATLNATLGFAPPNGSSFFIIVNDGSDPVVGTFAGLPQGASLLIGGTPFQISYTGGSGNDVVLTTTCPVITLLPSSLPNGVAGVSYSQSLSAMPSGGGYSFAVTGGSLPAGLTLMPNGTLSGVPLANGSYTFTVTATGFAPYACPGSQIYTLTIGCPTIALTPASLPNGTAGVAYSQAIGATPAGGGYTFAVTTGVLPAGLTLAANGTLAGTPTQSGTFNFRVTTIGFGICTAFQDYQLTIGCTTITLAPGTLPGGTVGTAYNQTVAASPAGSYNYAVTSGALPTGLSLNAGTGAITGAPTTTGSFNFTITASAGACAGSQSYTVTIACPSISLTTASPLPAGQAGVAYSQTLNVTPAGSYTFSLTVGSLPSGLALNPATGTISGIPSTTGTFTFTVKAQTAGNCSGTQSYTLTIGCPTITVNPSSLPNGSTGAAYSQTLSATPVGGSYTFAVTTGSLPTGLNLNSATGLLSGTPTVNGAFNFTVTATGFGGCTGNRAYSITIGAGGCPTITLPASLANGTVGQLYTVSAAASPAGGYSYAVSSGTLPPGTTLYTSFGLIYGFPTAAGSYTFTITATQGACTASQNYTVLISAGFASSLTVASDFDGDGKSDLSVFRADGNWAVANSGNGQAQATLWGAPYAPYNDLTVSGDYDGDGKTDLAVFRRGTEGAGHWFIKRSSDGKAQITFWGLPTDTPVPGDYDGDGKTDIAVWRGSEGVWFVIRSSDGKAAIEFWGLASLGDVAVPGDYDGDFKTDLAIFRRSTGEWYVKRSSDGVGLRVKWGVGTDVPVQGDYDGDGKTDYAVWRASEGNWYIVESGTAKQVTVSLGNSGDLPVVSDYDGDGKADPAIWQSATGGWQIKRSSDGTTQTRALGQSGDLPIPAKRN